MIGRKEMHEQRLKWENCVFEACETDTFAIQKYLEKLFTSTDVISAALGALRKATKSFESEMVTTIHFDDDSLKGVIQGLLRSDLLTDEKRVLLKDFINNKVVLAEVADVLNMRMKSLNKWKWDSKGTPIEQRRHLNGRYRFYHDEDLLQTIILRYIGLKWSIHFKNALTNFKSTAWASSSQQVPISDEIRRAYFLSSPSDLGNSLETERTSHFQNEIFLEQLSTEIDEQRAGYDQDSQLKTDTRKSGQQITQKLLHTLAAEIIMKTRFGEEVNVVRTDFAWFGPSLPHSTMFTVLIFFGVSENWAGFFQRALEAPMKFVQDGSDAPVQIRKRSTPISGPSSDMLGETVLFGLDFAFNQRTGGDTNVSFA